MGTRVHFLTDPAAFLRTAGRYLSEEPVLNTVVATAAQRALEAGEDPPPRPYWFLVAEDEAGQVVGAGIRTSPFSPYPIFLSPLPEDAARRVAQELVARGESAPAVNGAIPAARVCAEELARLTGGRVRVAVRTRLHRLDELTEPPPAPGRLRPVRADEAATVAAWVGAFGRDADEQAGRSQGIGRHEPPEPAWVERQISDRRALFWVVDDDPVHLTCVNPAAFGAVRIGPVYTPPGQRGLGWARSAVAEASRRIQAAGAQPCLFTDLANPTSNRLYEALGYRPVADMANLTVG